MPIYWMVAVAQKRTGHPNPVPVGGIRSIVFNFPGPKAAAVQAVVGMRWGTPGVDYRVVEVPSNDPTGMVLATEISTGGAPVAGGAAQGQQQVQLSGQQVAAGMAQGVPAGQVGQNRMGGPRDAKSGFEVLGDADLGGGGDAMFGVHGDEGTWTDIVQSGGVVQEVPRQVVPGQPG